MRTDEAYLLDIYQAAMDCMNAVAGQQLKNFVDDRLLQRIARSCLIDMGEASKKLSNSFKQRHPLVPWGELIVRRNELAHVYFRIDYGEVWHFVQTTVPGLIEYLEPLVPPENP